MKNLSKPLSHIHRIEMAVNNDRTMQLAQQDYDGTICFSTYNTDSGLVDHEEDISPADMVMLMNYYRHIKSNDIRCEFINPNGTLPF